MTGEDFLNRLYRDLNLSEEVQHTAKGSGNKTESVRRYMDRLERIHKRAPKGLYDLDRLKGLYHKKYCISEEKISVNDKSSINKQEESLDRWIDYLVSDASRYPMWAKYWAFQGMLKIGSYDINTGLYQKRSEKTLAPFIEVDPEIIDKCIEQMIVYVGRREVNDEELRKIIESGNFARLYISMLKRKKKKTLSSSDMIDGTWVKYYYETEEEADQKRKEGIKPEYVKLYDSLQGYDTKWCTAGSLLTAREQICGGKDYDGGDFYVYYTKDQNDKYKVPRIAIRMDGERIGEIRGVADGQNIEDGLEDVVQTKLNDFNLDTDVQNNCMKIISDMKKLTHIYVKFKKKMEFTIEDLRFVYELDELVEGFGWTKDERVREIIKNRDMKADFYSFSNLEDRIKFGAAHPQILEYIDKTIEGYKEIAIAAVNSDWHVLDRVDNTMEGYKDVVLAAVMVNFNAFNYVKSNVSNYYEIALEAAKIDGYIIRYVDKAIERYKEIAMEAVNSVSLAIRFIDGMVDGYRDIAMSAVRKNPEVIGYVDVRSKDYKEIAMEAIKYDSNVIKFINKNASAYNEIFLYYSELTASQKSSQEEVDIKKR